MTPKPAALAVLAVTLVAAAIGIYSYRRAPMAVAPPDTSTVTALGRLQPDSGVVNVGGPAGGRLDRFAVGVQEGGRVSAGAILAYLDSNAEAIAAREHAVSALAEAHELLRAEEAAGQAAVDGAALQIRRADATLPLKIEAQDADVRRSTVELEKLRVDLQRAEKMRAGNAILPAQYEAAALAVRQAEELLNRNRSALAEWKEERDIQGQSSRAGLRSAEAARIRARLSARVETLTDALKLADARLEMTRIRAPLSGEILELVTHAGEAIGAAPILRMGNTDTMVVVADVYETDVPLVRVGQKATVSSRTIGQPIVGQVERISRLIQRADVLGIDPTADTDARVVEVRIRLDANAQAGRYNWLQVDVRIDTSAPSAPLAPDGSSR